ncbi:MAG: histidine kinase [Clostridia bacterium]
MRKWLSDLPILRKMTILFFCCIMLPSLALGYGMYQSAFQGYVRSAVSDTREVLHAMKASAEAQASMVETNMELLAFNDSVLALLSNRRSSNAQRTRLVLNEVTELVKYSEMFLTDMQAHMTLYTADSDIPESYYMLMNLEHIAQEAGYRAFCESGTVTGWVGLEWIWPPDSVYNSQMNQMAFVCYRNIMNGMATKVGVLKCGVSPQALFHVLDEWTGADRPYVTRGGSPVYRADAVYQALLPDTETAYERMAEGNKLLIGVPSEKLGVTFGMEVDASTLYHRANALVGYLLFLIPATGVLLLLAARWTLSAIFARLKQVNELRSHVVSSDFSIRLPDGGKDEIGQLVNATNLLLEHVQAQASELVERERSERRAQILALQYQVNPHFLFNTMNWLQMSLEAHENCEELSDGIAWMAVAFRYNLAGEPLVSLKEELENMDCYARLSNLRKLNCLSVQTEIPPEHERLRVMRFMLQPVLENALKHGLNERGHITVRIQTQYTQGLLRITVTNDGETITPEKLRELNQSLAAPAEKAGIGLANTAARLRLLFGSDARMRIASDGGLTTVTLLFSTGRHDDGADGGG